MGDLPGIKALRRIQLGQEATAGTAVAPTALFRGLGVMENDTPLEFPAEDIGYISGVDRSYMPQVSCKLDLEDTPATFEQLPYLFEAGINAVGTGVADGAGSGKIYTYALPTTSRNTLKTFSVESGDDRRMEKAAYLYAESIRLSGKSKEAWMMSAALRGRQAAVNSYTASTISFDLETKTISDSADGLAGFATGSRITVRGTTNNDGTYTVATGATAGSIVVSESLVDESAGSPFTIEQTFTSIAMPAVEEILFQKSKLYIDAVGGTIGGTLKSNTFLAADISLKTGWIPVYTGDGNLYFSFIKLTDPELLIDITFEHDGSATAEKEYWLAQTARKMRILAEGSALATAGTTYSKKSLVIDAAGKWEKFAKLGEQDGNDIIQGTFRARYNATATLFAQFTVVNALTSLT